jgi:Ca2+-binding RTX toxin-like protein
MAQVDHWRDDLHRPWAKIDFHNSDVMASGGGYNETKINQIAAIVDAFKARTDYKLITLNAYYNRTRCGGQRVTMFGTPDSDDITGSAGGDVIKTFAGNDTVSAGDGDDLICAGKGDDVVDGGGGSNTIKGGGGTDTCTNGPTVRGCEQ